MMAVLAAILCGVGACADPDAKRMNRGSRQQAGGPSGLETNERRDELPERATAKDGHSTSHVWETALRKEPKVLSGHNRAIRCVAFSPDGTRLASASDDRTVRIWNMCTGDELAVLRGHEHSVSSLSFSPDSLRLATGSYDTTVRIWDTSTGRTLSILRGHEDLIRCVAFSPDGTRVASGSHDRTVRIWDAATGQALTTFQGDAHTVMSVAFSPDGARLLTAGHSVARVWDTATWKELLVLSGHERWIYSAAISRDGALVGTAGGDRTVRVWDASSGRRLATLHGHGQLVVSVAFCPDASCMVSGSDDNTVRLWETATRKTLFVLPDRDGTVWSVAFSPDGTRLATTSGSTLLVHDTATSEMREQERQAAYAARHEAKPIVDALWLELDDARSVVKRLRTRASLSAAVRREALNLLLGKSARRGEEIFERLAELYARLLFTDDVVSALEADESLDPSIRREAVMDARAKGDHPHRLRRDGWRLIQHPDRDAETYAMGLRCAEAVAAAKPDDGESLRLLGVAQYRNGHYEDALRTLRTSEKPSEPSMSGGMLIEEAIMAMSFQRLGRVEEATSSFERLQEKIEERPPEAHTMTHRLVEEALKLFGKATTSGADRATPSQNGDSADAD